MNKETSAGTPPRVQARGHYAAMQTEKATRADWLTRRRGESLAAVLPPDVETIGSRVEGAAREGLTLPEVLILALLPLTVLLVLSSMLLLNLILYVLPILVMLGLVILVLWSI